MRNMRFVLITGGVVITVGVLLVAGFVWKHGRGLGPVLRKPPEDITRVLNTTGMPLTLPPGFSISIFAKDLGKPRVLTSGPGGLVVVSIPERGSVVALPDRNHDGAADEAVTIVEGLNRPHGIRFLPGDSWSVFIAESHRVARWEYDAETMRATKPQTLIDLPDGGSHWSRTIELVRDADGGERIMVSVGSSCNVCDEKDERRASVLSANLDGTDLRTFASGLRNAVFLAQGPDGNVWATEMGRDLLGDDLPPDEINVLEDGRHYGWPNCYGKNVQDPFGADRGRHCQETEASHIDLPAHSAPLGLTFVPETGWPGGWGGDLLVAYHGSWNRSEPTGYKVTRLVLRDDGMYIGANDVITGWLTEGGRALGRPVDLLAEPEGVLYISDDKAGVVYRVTTSEYGDTGASDGCRSTGCSGQICADKDMITTCEYFPAYACYRDAECTRQQNGECGWAATPVLQRCLAEVPENL